MKSTITTFSKRVLAAVFVAGLMGTLSANFAAAQYDYYDPYSNSNIDYYPMNPVYTSPTRTTDSGTTGDTSGGTTGGTTATGGTVTSTACANTPKTNPQGTRSIEVRDWNGKVFYLSPPKEEVVGVAAYPETSEKIFQRIYDTSGKQINEREIGLITVNNSCYPKYGYIQDLSTLPPPTTSSYSTSVSGTAATESTTVPEDATAVKLDPKTGKVYNAKTGALMSDARYDAALRKIFYKDTNSTYGKVFTETTGYVNLDLRGVVDTSAQTSLTGDPDFDLLRVSPTPVSVGDVDRDGALDKTVPAPSSVDAANNENWNFGGKSILPTSEQQGGGSTGDPDFDLLRIDLGGDELEKMRAEISSTDPVKKATVRGWDPEKKEEIVGHPENVNTPEDLRVYAEAVALNDVALTGITINEGVLEVVSREEGKLFWFIPVTMTSRIIVDFKLVDSTGDPVDLKLPWWHVFVKEKYDPDVIEEVLRIDTVGVFDPSKWEKIDNSEAPTDLSRAARVLSIISNVMKTKHDTAKNSVGNIR